MFFVTDIKRYVAEFWGTFFLAMAVTLLVGNGVGVGLVFLGLLYAFSVISGGHFNPGVSLAVWLRGALSTNHLVGFIIAQILGATAAVGMVYAMTGQVASSPFGVKSWLSLGIFPELLCSALFYLVVLVVATTRRFEGHLLNGVILGLTLAGLANFPGIYNPAIGLSWLIANGIAKAASAGVMGMIDYATIFMSHVFMPFIGSFIAAAKFRWGGYENM